MTKKHVVARVYENPLPGIAPRLVRARVGAPVRDIIAGCKAPMVCLINGRPLARDYWMQRDICVHDKIEFHPVYLGGGGSRSILGAVASIALAAVMPAFVAGLSPALFGTATALTNLGRLVAAGLVLVGNAIISAILPAGRTNSNGQGDKASSIYDVDTQGNQAKIFAPVPVQYGRLKTYPDYAAQPYVKYHTEQPSFDVIVPDILKSGSTTSDGDTPEAEYKDGHQFYYALFCLGQGEYDVEEITIGDAPISSFQDVWVADILPPGKLPSHVKACVVTSEAVSGQSIDSGDFIGGFPVCGPGRRATKVSFDLVFPQGLCKLDDNGKAKSNSIIVHADIAPLSDAGKQTGEWENALTQTITASSLTPQRRTFEIDVTAGRYMLRLWREGKKDSEDNQDISSCQWQSLRAELDEKAPLCKTATHFELIMRASEQLSSLSQRKIAIICTRKVKDFDGNLVASRSPMLALLDKWTNSDYGDGLSLERIDIDTLRRYDELAAQRQDRFDYRFESRVTSEEADQLIAKVHRGVVLQRQGVKTFVRDEQADLPITLFNPTNTTDGSVSVDYVQVTEETSDGVIVEFFNRNTWDWQDVECPAPGRTYTNASHEGYNPALPSMENPARIRIEGITGLKHATREGMYYAYTNALRRQFVSWSTELQGALIYYGAPVVFTSTLYNSQGIGGEVVDYSDGALRLDTDIPAGASIIIMRADGTVTAPLQVQSLGDGWVNVAGDIPPISFGDYDRERTKYAVLTGEIMRRIVKLTSIEPRGLGSTGAPEYALRGVVDVPEVHSADNPWLPREGEEPQDIPEWDTDYDGDAPEPGGDNAVIKLQSPMRVYTQKADWPGSGYPAALAFFSDGAARMRFFSVQQGYSEAWENAPVSGARIVNWWAQGAPIENIGASYEIALAFKLPSADYLRREFMKYMWLEDEPPDNNMILQGHKLREITASTLDTDESTRQLVNRMGQDDFNWPFITEWHSLAAVVEFRAPWRGFSPIWNDGSLENIKFETMTGYVGIRDAASKTLQAVAMVEMGFK